MNHASQIVSIHSDSMDDLRLMEDPELEPKSGRIADEAAPLTSNLRHGISKLAFRSEGRFVFFDPDEIEWIESAANYVRINARGKVFPVRQSIGRLANCLDRRQFIRIHRSIIVNVHKIKELRPLNTGEFIATLQNGKTLSCGRSFRRNIDEYITRCNAPFRK